MMKATAYLCAGLVVAALTRTARAEEGPVAAELSLFSAYVTRGQVINNEPVLQPSLTAGKHGFAFNAWMNMNLSDSDARSESDDSWEFTEVDFTLSYTRAVAGAELTLGVSDYLLPNNTLADSFDAEGRPVNGVAYPNSRELFLDCVLTDAMLEPEATVYYDFDDASGSLYATVGIGHSLEMDEKTVLHAGCSTGYGNRDYNDYYFGVDQASFNDGNVWLSADFRADEQLTISPLIQYTWLWDPDIRNSDGTRTYYLDTSLLWGGVTVSCTF